MHRNPEDEFDKQNEIKSFRVKNKDHGENHCNKVLVGVKNSSHVDYICAKPFHDKIRYCILRWKEKLFCCNYPGKSFHRKFLD